jgi:hypothetical protein
MIDAGSSSQAASVAARDRVIVLGLVLLIVVGVVVTAAGNPGLVTFVPKDAGQFLATMAPLVLVSLFIERALEVFMTTWRGPDAARLTQEARLAAAGGTGGRTEAAALLGYKATTQRIAFLTGIGLGVVVSALGVRGLGQFVDLAAFEHLEPFQRDWFNACDVLLTGAVLGGGADGLHKFIVAFTTFLDTTARRNQAASPTP